ncbi:MAG: hypothetical protein ABI411_01410 [Tahibacter sp.]
MKNILCAVALVAGSIVAPIVLAGTLPSPPSFTNGLEGDAPSTVVTNTPVTLTWAANADLCGYAGSQFPDGVSFSQWPLGTGVCANTGAAGCSSLRTTTLNLIKRGVYKFNVQCARLATGATVNSSVIVTVIGPPTSEGVILGIESDTAGPIRAGATFGYNLVVRNFGDATLDGRSVELTLPTGVGFVSSTCNAQFGNGKVIWTVNATVAVNASRSCKVSVRLNAIPGGEALLAQAQATFSIAGVVFTVTSKEELGTARLARPISKTLSGAPTTADSAAPSLSGDGSILAFTSEQQGLVDNDTNSTGADIFVRDRRTGVTQRVQPQGAGGQPLTGTAQEPVLSLNGKAIAFVLRNASAPSASAPTGQAGLVAAASDAGQVCVASSNGLYQPVCTSSNGAGQPIDGAVTSPSLSADGNLMAFCSAATNWVSNDTNGASDVFVKNQTTGVVTRVSVDGAGNQGQGDSCDPNMAGSGNFVVFRTKAPNLGGTAAWQVVRKDLRTGSVQRISQSTGGDPAASDTGKPSVSADGRRITFASRSTNLIAGFGSGKRNVFIYNDAASSRPDASQMPASLTLPSSLAGGLYGVKTPTGQAPDGDAADPAISCNGGAVAFASLATNLVPGDGANQTDVFVVDAETGVARRTVTSAGSAEPNGPSGSPSLDCEGTTGAFATSASNVDPSDTNGNSDVYVQPDPLRNDAASLRIDQSYSGNWYNPGQNGHGLLIEALGGDSFYVTWYLFSNGQPLYLQGLASPVGNVLTVPVYSTTSSGFPIGTGPVVNDQWGTLRITFTDSSNGRIDWTPTRTGFTVGGMTLRRLTSPSPVQSDVVGTTLKACYSGVWFEPARSGYGFDFEINDFSATDRAITAYWYTFQPDGKALWLVGAGKAFGGSVVMDMYQFGGAGAQFPPAFASVDVAATKWGSVTLRFLDNDRATVSYTPVLTGYAAGNVTLQRLTALRGRECTN